MVKGNGNKAEVRGSVLGALERSGGAPKAAAGHRRVRGIISPDTEVLEKPQRRRSSAEYKARIVQEADSCTEAGQIGALLRREGLYSSYLTVWRKAYRQGVKAALTDNKRGRKLRLEI
ncbi:MAG: helix-turn-helix domain-containing protein [Deltaproteobacteria bacterium]|nr:helix-turn-helix domain-containing protein [Deltaproteobacteria bacterium]